MVGKIPGMSHLTHVQYTNRHITGYDIYVMPTSLLMQCSSGLISLHTNPPLPISVPRAKGFDMGLVAVLESPEHVASYATHPAHLEYVYYLLSFITVFSFFLFFFFLVYCCYYVCFFEVDTDLFVCVVY